MKLHVSNVGIDLTSVAEYLLDKESFILANFPFISTYGSLPLNSVTTRAGGYNVFSFVTECPDLKILLDHIRQEYEIYTKAKNISNRVVCPAINCWMNVLRSGEHFHEHNHAEREESFVSGALSIQVENTETYYKINGEIVETISNLNGDLTLFPCNLYHGTSTHQAVKPRITLGMNIYFDIKTCSQAEHFNETYLKL